MSWWESLDIAVFYWINTGWSNPVFDVLLPLFREKLLWAPFYLFILAFVLQNCPYSKALPVLLGLVLTVGLSDFTSSTIVKKNVQRVRPCNDPEMQAMAIQRISCGSGYSFTSSHAANHFAVAMYLGLLFGRLGSWVRPALMSWASLIALSQVYVGVHYPGDILCGALLGLIIGWGVFSLGKITGWRRSVG